MKRFLETGNINMSGELCFPHQFCEQAMNKETGTHQMFFESMGHVGEWNITPILCYIFICTIKESWGKASFSDWEEYTSFSFRTSSSQTQRDIKSVSTLQVSLYKHDSMTGITMSEQESQIGEGLVESSMIEQESWAQTASLSVPHLPRAGKRRTCYLLLILK